MTEDDKRRIQEEFARCAKKLVDVRKEEEAKRREIAKNLENFYKAVDQRVDELRRQDEFKAKERELAFNRNSELMDEALKSNDVEAIQKLLKDFNR